MPFTCEIPFHFIFSFKKLVAIWQEEIGSHGNSGMEMQSELVVDGENTTYYKDDEVPRITNDLLDSSIGSDRYKALQKYLSIGEQLYQKACQVDAKIHGFETHIRRPYFHVKPLDVSQLENWHLYLNFVEAQGDFDWVWFYIILVLMWALTCCLFISEARFHSL